MKILFDRTYSYEHYDNFHPLPTQGDVVRVLHAYFDGSFMDDGSSECFYIVRKFKPGQPYPESIAGKKFDRVCYGDKVYCEKTRGYLSEFVVVTKKDFAMLEAMKDITEK